MLPERSVWQWPECPQWQQLEARMPYKIIHNLGYLEQASTDAFSSTKIFFTT